MEVEIAPAIIVPDVSPLIHLAAAGRLSLLQHFGRVLVMDVIAFEATSNLGKPWARQVADWIVEESATTDRPRVEVVVTEIGEAYRLARQSNPRFRLRNAGENAIRDWLVETLPIIGGPALVIYEDSRMPKLLQREQLAEVVVVATTRALLEFAEERGLIESAENTWNEISSRAQSANPRSEVKVMRPIRDR